MKRLASSIVRHRILLMVAVLLLGILSVFGIARTGINYDLTAYLAEDTITKRGLEMMEREFQNTSSLSVVLIDASPDEARFAAETISGYEGVMSAAFDEETGARTEGGKRYDLIQIIMREESAESVYAQVMEGLGDRAYHISGPIRDSHIIRDSLQREMPLVMAVSAAIVLLVLLLMSRSAFAPVLFAVYIVVSILLNMGTNWIFSSISFITFAVAAILQLALAMDYSIMLMNAYDRFLDQGLKPPDAMTEALAASFMPIVSSATTTVAGMLSLLFMSFTIGFDIGIVLAKGIVFSMLSVFLLMPGLLVLSTPLLRKTAHKPLRISGKGVASFMRKTRGAVAILLLAAVAVSAVVQTGNTYTYTVRDMDADSKAISDLFGRSQQMVLLFPVCADDESYARQTEMLQKMQAITIGDRKAVNNVYAMPVTGEMAIRYYEAADLAELLGTDEARVKTMLSLLGISLPERGDRLIEKLSSAAGKMSFLIPKEYLNQLDSLSGMLDLARETFNGPEHSRAILSLDLSYTDEGTQRVLQEIRDILSSYYGTDWAMAGTLTATDDIAASFRQDVQRVSWITIIAVFLIILFSFRNLLIPLLLVCVIQGAIWINMAYSGRVDGSIFFMCYLICMALQMGATIDYGILLTKHYRDMRRTMDKSEAIKSALDHSMQTILTSGLALITAGFAVGRISSVFYISSIGTMLGRGAIVSVLLILLLLPQMLLWMDQWITGPSRSGT